MICFKGKPEEIWKEQLAKKNINSLNFNRDYEPYSTKRDEKIISLFKNNKIEVHTYKDQVIFEKGEVLKNDGLPYTVYTPYKNKWLAKYETIISKPLSNSNYKNLVNELKSFPSKKELGIEESSIKVKPFSLDQLENYSNTRDFPSTDGTSYLSPHLRFGTISSRQVITMLNKKDDFF